LLVYHFMFAEGWSEGCHGCSFLADHFDGANLHLAHHDVSLVAVSRAPYAEFQAFRQRMGWQFPWYSSNGSGFNEDFGVSVGSEGQRQYNYEPYEGDESELPGLSAFYREPDGSVYQPMLAGWISWSTPTIPRHCATGAQRRWDHGLGAAP
jgi:predicted dithiol-disulfide oxidoreductase (DUF899 family)